jgi:hypothetical protein
VTKPHPDRLEHNGRRNAENATIIAAENPLPYEVERLDELEKELDRPFHPKRFSGSLTET